MKNYELPVQQMILAATEKLGQQREDFITHGIPPDLAWRLYIDAGLVGALLLKSPTDVANEMRAAADRIERLEFKPMTLN